MEPKPPSDQQTEMTLQEAIDIIEMSGALINFGKNVEARRRYYERRALAIRIAQQAGYFVTTDPRRFGVVLKSH